MHCCIVIHQRQYIKDTFTHNIIVTLLYEHTYSTIHMQLNYTHCITHVIQACVQAHTVAHTTYTGKHIHKHTLAHEYLFKTQSHTNNIVITIDGNVQIDKPFCIQLCTNTALQ